MFLRGGNAASTYKKIHPWIASALPPLDHLLIHVILPKVACCPSFEIYLVTCLKNQIRMLRSRVLQKNHSPPTFSSKKSGSVPRDKVPDAIRLLMKICNDQVEMRGHDGRDNGDRHVSSLVALPHSVSQSLFCCHRQQHCKDTLADAGAHRCHSCRGGRTGMSAQGMPTHALSKQF